MESPTPSPRRPAWSPPLRLVARSSGASLVAAALVAFPLATAGAGLEAGVVGVSTTTSTDPLAGSTSTTLAPIDGVSYDLQPAAGSSSSTEDDLLRLVAGVPVVGEILVPSPPSSPTPSSPPPTSGGGGSDSSDPRPTTVEPGGVSPEASASGSPLSTTLGASSAGTVRPGNKAVRLETPAAGTSDGAGSNGTAPTSSDAPSGYRRFAGPDRGLTEDPERPVPAMPMLRSTAAVFDILRGLDLSPAAVAKVVAPFPVAGVATYTADFGTPRHGPGAGGRRHEGIDIFAGRGTPVIAAAAGVLSDVAVDRGLAGTSLRLTGRDRTVFVYAHLDRFAAGIAEGDVVAKGQVLGFVGTTGNEAKSPHLHFEIRPSGGAPVDPAPFLDRWLVDATATARLLASAPAGTLAFERAAAADAAAMGAASRGRPSSAPSTRGARTLRESVTAPLGWVIQPIAAVSDRAASDWAVVAAGLAALLTLGWRARRRFGNAGRQGQRQVPPLPLDLEFSDDDLRRLAADLELASLAPTRRG